MSATARITAPADAGTIYRGAVILAIMRSEYRGERTARASDQPVLLAARYQLAALSRTRLQPTLRIKLLAAWSHPQH